jgi:hypothetical protein
LGVGCGGGKMRRLDGVVVRYSGYRMTSWSMGSMSRVFQSVSQITLLCNPALRSIKDMVITTVL